MLVKFAVTNFRGFAKRIELDLSRHRDYAFNSFAVRDGIIKNGIIYGPNGSGKSNLGLAIFDIVNHLSNKHKEVDYYANFTNTAAVNQDVIFEYEFRLGDKRVQYDYTKTSRGVLRKERLVVDEKEVFNRDGKNVVIDRNEFMIEDSVFKNLIENANGISIVVFLLVSFPLTKGHYLILLRDFVDSMLWFRSLDERKFIGFDSGVSLIYVELIRKGRVDDFKRFLKDVSKQDFDFLSPQKGDKELLCKIGDGVVPFLKIVSTGTSALGLLYFWLERMGRASFVFIDEFDAFYHFELSYAVCKELFKRKCQVFLSSHNTYLMTNDLLRPDCNFVILDNDIKAICDRTDKDLRLGHNIEKLYRGGAFE